MIGFKSNFVVLVFFRNSYVSEACTFLLLPRRPRASAFSFDVCDARNEEATIGASLNGRREASPGSGATTMQMCGRVPTCHH